jgi:hypothetical protein
MHLDSLEMLIRKAVSSTSWMTAKEAADFPRCSVRKVEDFVYKGLLPYKRLGVTGEKSPRLFHRKHLTGYLVAERNPVQPRLSPAERRMVEELLM